MDLGGHVHLTFARGRPEIDAIPVSFYSGGGGSVYRVYRSLQNTENAANLLLPLGTNS